MSETAVQTEPSVAEIRAWARDNGHAVGTRGRLPQAVVDAYKAARAA